MAMTNDWFIAVFHEVSSEIKKTLVEIYRFIDDVKGVQKSSFFDKR